MSEQQLQYISQLLYNNFHIPLFILNKQTERAQVIGTYVQSPLFDCSERFVERLLDEQDELHVPLLRITNYLETFVLLHVCSEYAIILGPFTNFQMTESSVNHMMHDYNISLRNQQALYNYYSQLEVLNQKQIIDICSLLYFLLYQQPLDVEQLRAQIFQAAAVDKMNEEQAIRDLRLHYTFHLDHEVEQKIWQYVKEGKKEKLLEHLESIDMDTMSQLSKKSHLRNMKNQVIIYITLATRAAIEGGLYAEIAYTMSDVSIQKVEETNDLQKLFLIGDSLVFALIDRMNENKVNVHSKPVNVCKNYIFTHLFEPITIADLAQLVQLNAVYLSQLFKKETGKPLGKYIQEEKLKEAQQLLRQTKHSIADISMLLHFSSQSHFTALFKQFTGVTPKQYRTNRPSHL